MTPFRLAGGTLPLLFAVLLSTACTKRDDVAAASEPSSAPAPAAEKSGIVALRPESPEARGITVEVVRAVPLPADEVIAPARIQLNPNRVAHAVLPVAGRIARVMVKLGDAVTKGQPVALVDSPAVSDAESAFAQSQAGVHQAELAIAKADADLARLTTLFEHGATAEKEVISARTTLALAKDALDQAQSVREQARRRLELLGLKAGPQQQQVVVDAPLPGKVLSIDVAEGEYRNETSTSLVTIGDLSRIWATSDVPENDIRHFKTGGIAELELIAYPGETFRAQVTRIADTVDKDTRTIQVSAELDNSLGRLRPEMYGRLRYRGALVPTPWVPESAVVENNGTDLVFVELSPARFQAIRVDLGKRHEGGFAILKGLKPGDRVATQGAVYLKAAL
jgi:cobalt-zinc-cadmium efflux system membrane fusion protein